MLLEIVQADYLGDYRFRLVFNDGRSGEADLHALIDPHPDSVFAPFTQEAFVRQFRLEHGTLGWLGELDVAAEYLYFLAFRDDSELQNLFCRWGYLPDSHCAVAAPSRTAHGASRRPGR